MKARQFTLAIALVSLFTVENFAQTTFFVKAGAEGTGRGTSWTNAATDLQAVLVKASKGDQIWVAEGMYFPTSGNDRSMAFEIPDGVQVLGGFVGNEKSATDRKIELHPTILSGNIGTEDAHDNSFNVVVMRNCSEATVLEGFLITNGHANGNDEAGKRNRSGGGLFMDASKSASPMIRNCVFIDNFAKDGGAIYVNARNGGKASPTFKSCSFDSNKADLDGGAVNLDGRSKGESNPTFYGCTFDNNKGNYGGGVFTYALNGDATPTMTNCRFTANSAYVKGGAIFQLTTNMSGEIELEKVVFSNNEALDHDSDNYTHYAVSSNEFASK